MLALVRFAKRRAKGTSAGLSSKMVIAAAAWAAWAPEPMAIPTSAAARAAMSFMPSPTIAVTASDLSSVSFSSGLTPPLKFTIPSS